MIPSDKFFITHTTNINNLESILENRSLQPLSLIRKLSKDKISYESISNYYSQAKNKEKYINSVFYGFLYPTKENELLYKPFSDIHFIFSSNIVKDNAFMYGRRGVKDLPIFCKGWNYGAIDQNCYYYDTKKSLEENLNIWRVIALNKKFSFDPWTSTSVNEILMEGEMPLDLDLVCIYVTKYSLTMKGKDPEKTLIMELKEKYPEYNWIEDYESLSKLIDVKPIPGISEMFDKF
jgi:hypothetical protein